MILSSSLLTSEIIRSADYCSEMFLQNVDMSWHNFDANKVHCRITVLSSVDVGEKTWLAGPHLENVGNNVVRIKVYFQLSTCCQASEQRG